ncbi:oxidoreductase [Peribacillus deserti]|uniref:Oxidoreductase n=2 Tax=Peribacillus deserti TaxID=673318 RepID=A0A2N5M8I7_9BACI|nr:DoxX family protein [Peribacillus deserti]PLT30655.1 oxidoreductase [Peribacillus deserti]
MKKQYAAAMLRVLLGLVFLIHGYSKFQGGIQNTAGFFESLGLPGFTAYIVASIELAGGLAMIVGIGTRYIGVLFALILAGAIVKVKWTAGFLGNGQMAGYELDLILLVLSIYFVINNRTELALENTFHK